MHENRRAEIHEQEIENENHKARAALPVEEGGLQHNRNHRDALKLQETGEEKEANLQDNLERLRRERNLYEFVESGHDIGSETECHMNKEQGVYRCESNSERSPDDGLHQTENPLRAENGETVVRRQVEHVGFLAVQLPLQEREVLQNADNGGEHQSEGQNENAHIHGERIKVSGEGTV